MAVAINPFASTHPAIDALFSREFAGRQMDQAAAEAAAMRGVQRESLRAQSDLAQSQLRQSQAQQDYNNLFRMQQLTSQEKAEADRNALLKRELDIREKGGTRPAIDAETRKRAIIDTNATAVNEAARANALFKIELDAEIARAKEKDVASVMPGLFGGLTAKKIDDLNSPERKAIQKKVFDTVYRKLVAEKGGTVQMIIPDSETFTFKPVQYDEDGKAIALPLPSPATSGAGAAAGIGTMPTTAGTGSVAPDSTAVGTEAQNLFRIGEPIIRKGINAFRDMLLPGTSATTSTAPPPSLNTRTSLSDLDAEQKLLADYQRRTAPLFDPTAVRGTAPPVPSVRRALGNSTVLLLPEDDALLARQLLSVPVEQRPTAYRVMIDQWLQAGRAVMVPPATPVIPYEEPNYNRF